MVPVDQIANGLMIYARQYLIEQIPKNSFKYVAANVGLELIGVSVNRDKQAFKNKVLKLFSDSPVANMLDVVTPEGMVDVEFLKNSIPKYIQPEGIKIQIPKIGTFVIQPNDVDVIYNCIINCPTT